MICLTLVLSKAVHEGESHSYMVTNNFDIYWNNVIIDSFIGRIVRLRIVFQSIISEELFCLRTAL